MEGHPPRGDGGVSDVEVRLARIREDLAPEKVAQGGHGDAEVQRALDVLHDVEKVLLGLSLLFGAGAVKGRVTWGDEKEYVATRSSTWDDIRVESCIEVDPTSLSLLTSRNRATGAMMGGEEKRYGKV